MRRAETQKIEAGGLTDSRSRELYQRARALLPGGVNSPPRAMRAVGREPLFIERGVGPEVVDVDGNRFIDYVCSWGPLIHGHAHPAVVSAVSEAAARGTTFGAPTEAEIELAAEVVGRVPSAEMVRLTSSGTEATMTALRLARSATGRERVLKFSGAYHGHVDGLLATAGSGLATAGIPSSPGVTAAQAANTVVVPWNDEARLEEVVDRAGSELAAVIAEPVAANMGVVPPRDGFLELLRERTRACGALLVLDEVISGFRVAPGGAQERYSIDADLTILGKVLGGGLPLAAVAGPRELLERLAPSGDTYQGGTLSGNPLATAAGLATLRLLDLGAYRRLEDFTARLADGLRDAAGEAGVPVRVNWLCGLLTVFFGAEAVESFEDAQATDTAAFARYFAAMLEQGVYLPPSAFEAWFPSLAHGERELERTLEAAGAAFATIVS